MQQMRLLFTTALLTIFVWASADQLVTETADLPVTISVQAEPNSDMVVTMSPGEPAGFRVTVSGRQADVAALREAGTLPVTLTLKDAVIGGREIGPLTLSLRDELRANPAAFGSCVVQRTDPSTILVLLDQYIAVAVPVRVRSSSLDFAVDPRVEPEMVTVRILKSIHQGMKDAGPRMVLDVESYLKNQPQAEPIKLEVPLAPEVQTDRGSYPVFRVTPDTVTLRATLRRRLMRATIQVVPIKFQVGPNVHRGYDIEFRKESQPETLSVDVVGPPEEVERLVSGERKTFAVIAIGGPEPFADGAFQFVEPEFNLPPGVELAEDQPLPSFEIRLVPRALPSPGEDRIGP